MYYVHVHSIEGASPLTELCCFVSLQSFGTILDVEIIFNERGSKVRASVIVTSFTLCVRELPAANATVSCIFGLKMYS